MDTVTVITIVAIILAALIAVVFIRFILSNSLSKDRKEANNFLSKFEDTLYKAMLDIVVKYDYTKYNDIIELQIDLINDTTKYANSFINIKTEEALKSKEISNSIFKLLSTENSDIKEKFINTILDKLDIEYYTNSFLSKKFEEGIKANEELEKEINAQFDSNEFFTDEEVTDETELEPENYDIPEEELKNINPPREDGEEAYNPDDESMEIIEVEEELLEEDKNKEDIKNEIFIDANGRARDKSGKFVKTNK